MQVDVLLYGHLRKFGRKFTVDIESPRDAMSFLFRMVPGFEDHMERHSQSHFRMILDGEDSDEKRIYQPLFGVKQIKLVPVVRGAKSDGVQVIVGAALIVAGIALAPSTGGASLQLALSNMAIGVGASMVLGGVAQMLASNPSLAGSSGITPDYSAGKFFSGPSLVRYWEFKGNMHRDYESEAIKALPVARPSSLKSESEVLNMR